MGDIFVRCRGTHQNGKPCENAIHLGGVNTEVVGSDSILHPLIEMIGWTAESPKSFCAFCSARPQREPQTLSALIANAWDEAQSAESARDLYDILDRLNQQATEHGQ